MSGNLRNFALWVVIVLLLLALFALFENPGQQPPTDSVPWFVSLLVSWLPFIALGGLWIFLWRQQLKRGSNDGGSQAEIDALKRQIADMQLEIDRLRSKDK